MAFAVPKLDLESVKTALGSTKALAGLGLALFLLLFVAGEYVIGPGLSGIEDKKTAISKLKEDLKQKRALLKQYEELKEKLEGLPSRPATLTANEAPKVRAVSLQQSIQAQLEQLAQTPLEAKASPNTPDLPTSRPLGESPAESTEPTEPEGKEAEAAPLGPPGATPVGAANTLPGVTSFPGSEQPTTFPPPAMGASQPSAKAEPLKITRFTSTGQRRFNLLEPSATPLSPQLEGQLSKLDVWFFDYDLQLQGSYLALSRALNTLVFYQPLLLLHSLDVERVDAETIQQRIPETMPQNQAQPLPADLQMSITFSVVLEAV